ncbi:MAG: DnaB-like helicase N-terminal domain-containing protein, partial [Patescibacteria group bacterium]
MNTDNKNISNDLMGKVPPHSIEAEESLLGCLLIDKDAIIKVADTVMSQDFYKDSHKIIYEAIKELYNHQEPIDIITLVNRLEEKNQLTA